MRATVEATGLQQVSERCERSTMQAIVQGRYGSADVLRLSTLARPLIADDDVLVRVRAAGVHVGEVHLMTGTPYLMRSMGFGLRAPKARVRGTDLAGIVEAVGNNVSQFRIGDAVFGSGDGAFAEYTRARTQRARHTGAPRRRRW